MIKRLRTMWLKHWARRAYIKATKWRDDMSCGYAMATTMRPSILIHEARFNVLADRLSKLDENCPQFRFKGPAK